MRALAIVLLLSGCTLAQSSGVQPANGPTVTVAEHPLHSDYVPLSTEHSLLALGPDSVEHGEQPMSEFVSASKPHVSLGEIARQYRAGKKPNIKIVWMPWDK